MRQLSWTPTLADDRDARLRFRLVVATGAGAASVVGAGGTAPDDAAGFTAVAVVEAGSSAIRGTGCRSGNVAMEWAVVVDKARNMGMVLTAFLVDPAIADATAALGSSTPPPAGCAAGVPGVAAAGVAGSTEARAVAARR